MGFWGSFYVCQTISDGRPRVCKRLPICVFVCLIERLSVYIPVVKK